MPRVLHLVPTLYGDEGELIGGAERYVFELARHMAEKVPTTLLSFGPEPHESSVGKLRLRILAGAWRVRKQTGNPLHPLLLQEIFRADTVHCHQTHVLASSLSALICRVTRRRVFATDLGGGGWDLSAYVSTDRWFDGHLHISRYSREIYGHSKNARARVILGGVDTEKFSPLGESPSRSYALFVGRLLPHKGVDDLIRAVPDDLPLRVVGKVHDPHYMAELESLSEGKMIQFHHDVRDEALVRMYHHALCLVLPSVYRSAFGRETQVPELLGQTLLEAMASGTPVICTDVASMPEIVDDGVTGFIVPPNDPPALRARMDELRRDPARICAMGTAARSAVLERFSWPAVVDRCLDAYTALI